MLGTALARYLSAALYLWQQAKAFDASPLDGLSPFCVLIGIGASNCHQQTALYEPLNFSAGQPLFPPERSLNTLWRAGKLCIRWKMNVQNSDAVYPR